MGASVTPKLTWAMEMVLHKKMQEQEFKRQSQEIDMAAHYIRCNKGHIDLWYDNSEGEECPLCEVISRGWGKPKRT